MNTHFPDNKSAVSEEFVSESEQTKDKNADILAYLLQMEQKIAALERVIYSDTSRVKLVPPGLRREGLDYVARNKVHVAVREIRADGEVFSGSVLCSFGFVHHPWVQLQQTDTGIQISGYRCDCQRFADGDFCEHCAAIFSGAYPDGTATILPNSARDVHSDVANRQAGVKSVSIIEQSEQEGDLLVRGKTVCSFNFIHRPELRLSADGSIKAFSCTCDSLSEKMCIHCSALKPLAIQQLQTEALEFEFKEEDRMLEDTEELFQPDDLLPDFTLAFPDESMTEEPETEDAGSAADDGKTMTICFGTDVETGESVLWSPNDTNQVTHINMGIIGTMGTGKTQFTKSVITQLHRQQHNNPGAEKMGILIFDYKGDYNEEKTEFVNAVDARVLKLDRLPFNPFALNDFKVKPRLHVHTAMTFADTLTRIYGLGPIQKTVLVQAILAAYDECGINGEPSTWRNPAPTFAQVYKQYNKGRSQRGDSLAAAMDTIAMFDLFESDPMRTVSLYEMLHGVVVIDLSGYPGDLKNLAVAIILDLFYAQMMNSSHSRLVTTPDGAVCRQIKKVILVDEADNIMSSGLPVLRNIIKEGREFGVGMVLSTQFLDHFRADDEDYRKYMKTWVVHNVENLKKSDVEYVFQLPGVDEKTETIFQAIKQLEKHHSLVRIGTGTPAYVQDLPFFRIAEDQQESYLPTEIDSGEATPE